MLDIKRIREDFEGVKARVEFRGKGDFGIDNVKKLDEQRRELLAEVETMKNKQNTVSREIPKLKMTAITLKSESLENRPPLILSQRHIGISAKI